MLRQRIQSGLIIGAALLAAAFWMPPVGVLFVLLGISSLALWEFYKLLDSSGMPHFKYLGLLGGAALITSTWLSFYFPEGAPFDTDWLVLFFVVSAVFIRQFPQKNNPRPLTTISSTLLGVMYVAFLFNFFTKLLLCWGEQEGRWLVIYAIVVVKFTDIGAYFSGCWFGKHKLFPRISPKKTWEGVLGGVGVALLASLFYYFLMKGHIRALHITLWDALAIGVILALAGIIGDLTESLFKRAAGIKDSGGLILGMGGVLDVIDSLLFAAPAMYAYARFFME